jgi:glycosyltransferase involved in cell wall biosynthesis
MEQVVQSLARHQHEHGMQVRVLTSDHGQDDLPQEDERFPVSRLKSIYIAHTPIIPSLLLRLIGLDKGSIIHLHVSCAYTPEVVWLYAWLTGHRYVAHVHLDVPPSGRAGGLLGPYKRFLLRPVLRGAAVVLVPTPDYRELISGKYGIPRERIVVIGNATEHQIADQPKLLIRGSGPGKLLFVGRLSAQKNIPMMLESMARYVQKYGSNVRLSIVGEGELRAAVQAQIHRLALAGIATLHGRLHGPALQAAYEGSDLLLLTSTDESFGLVFIEAMTKGLPIVSVNIPAVRNVVISGVNGILAESNPEAVADAIHELLTDEILYAEISRNNLTRSRVSDWSAIVEELAAVYGSV